MEEKLLRREEEFHRYNAELELKTKSLMKEAEIIMSEQENLKFTPTIDYSCVLSARERDNDRVNLRKTSIGDSPQNFEFSMALISNRTGYGSCASLQSIKEPLFETCGRSDTSERTCHEKKKSSASESIIRVLQTKVKVLQSELNTVRSDYKKKTEELEKHKAVVKQFDEEKKKASVQISTLQEQLSRRQISISDISSKLREKETENTCLKKEIENLKKELKSVSQIASASDVRLNRALEEVDKLKNALRTSALQGKELQAAARKSAEDAAIVVKKMGKQKAELMNSFRQQVKLIENFKAQMVNYEGMMMGSYIEEMFLQLLDCGSMGKYSSEKTK